MSGPHDPPGTPDAPTTSPFRACARAATVPDACTGLVDDLVHAGFALPSVYLLSGRRLRCVAARGYFQVIDGFSPGRGVVGSVVASGRRELVQDAAAHPDFLGAMPGLVAEACSPVVVDGHVVGAVSVESASSLPDDALEFVDAAAQALGQRVGELGGLPAPSPVQVLAQNAVTAVVETDLPSVERRAVEVAVEMSALRSAGLAYATPDGPVLAAAAGPLSEQMHGWTAADLSVLASWVSADTSSHFPGGGEVPPEYAFLRAAGVRALSVHPLVTGRRADGWLLLADTVPVIQPSGVVELLEILAGQTAASVRFARLLSDDSEQAKRDPLTGLGTRAQLADTTQALLDARSHGTGRVGLLLLDLDDFRHVNDALGHQAGDELLVAVAQRVRESLREGDVACRIGGDEFAVVLPGTSLGTAVDLAQRMLAALSRPVTLGGTEIEATASVGVAVSGEDDASSERLLRAADLAMYLAKERGKARYALFEPQMHDVALNRLALLSDLRKAVREDGLTLVYQPIVDAVAGTMTGLEALVRWDRPGHGPVSPAEFIPLAEETGLILPLGEWVLRESCAQLLLWDAQGADPRLKLSVNLSTRQLERGSLLSVLDACLAGGVAPSRLILEITETALSLDSRVAREMLQAIRNRGVQLAVDDFGTGYSSLGLLRSAPVSRLKIDRQFVNEIGAAGDAVPIVDATIAMARGLGLALVAEGVETPAQLAYLRNAGCAEIQGFLLARPLTVQQVAPLIRGARPWSDELHPVPSPVDEPLELTRLIDLTVKPTVSLEDLVRPLLAQLETMTGLEVTYLTSVDPARTAQRVDFARSPAGSALTEGLVVPWQDTLCSRALTTGPQSTSDAQQAFPDAAVARDLELRAYAVEPVFGAEGQLAGTLCAASRTAVALGDSETATLRLFARLVSEKLRRTASRPGSSDVAAPLERPAAQDPGRLALSTRRQAGAQAWSSTREARRSGARADLAAHPAAIDARRRLELVAATDAAFQRHIAQSQDAAETALARRVVVGDDDALVREIVAAFIELNPRLQLVAQLPNGAEVVGASIAEQPDLVVLDYDLGDMTAEEVIPDLRAFAPGTQILLHSARPDVLQLGQQLGVDRAVYKGDGIDRLVEALDGLAG